MMFTPMEQRYFVWTLLLINFLGIWVWFVGELIRRHRWKRRYRKKGL